MAPATVAFAIVPRHLLIAALLARHLSSRSLEHIALGSIIGEGAFGKVYLGQDRRTGRLLAVKQLRVAADEVEGGSEAVSNALAEAEAEIGILTTCVHRNIVRCLGSERTAGPAGPGPNAGGFFLHIFMEYVSGGSVASLIGKVGPLGEAVVRVRRPRCWKKKGGRGAVVLCGCLRGESCSVLVLAIGR